MHLQYYSLNTSKKYITLKCSLKINTFRRLTNVFEADGMIGTNFLFMAPPLVRPRPPRVRSLGPFRVASLKLNMICKEN